MMQRMGYPVQHGKKWDWRIRWRQRWHQIPGYASKTSTRNMGQMIDELAEAVELSRTPPRRLHGWIVRMPEKAARKLIKIGLLDARWREADVSIDEHIKAYEKVVAARPRSAATHARTQAHRVRFVVERLKVGRVEELRAGDVEVVLKEHARTVTTRRHYLVALRDFCKWMVRDKRAVENPLADLQLPSADADPTVLRRPLSIDQVRQLFTWLDGQGDAGGERKLVYWLAIRTGLRAKALLSLVAGDVLLDREPAMIRSWAGYQKNRTEHLVPIGPDLVAALREHTQHMAPLASLFRLPVRREHMATMLREDLAAAGVAAEYPRGDGKIERIDFHALRATAIVHWLTIDKLDQLTVARLANLKTLWLVQKYAQHFRVEAYPWLANQPDLSSKPQEEEKTG